MNEYQQEYKILQDICDFSDVNLKKSTENIAHFEELLIKINHDKEIRFFENQLIAVYWSPEKKRLMSLWNEKSFPLIDQDVAGQVEAFRNWDQILSISIKKLREYP